MSLTSCSAIYGCAAVSSVKVAILGTAVELCWYLGTNHQLSDVFSYATFRLARWIIWRVGSGNNVPVFHVCFYIRNSIPCCSKNQILQDSGNFWVGESKGWVEHTHCSLPVLRAGACTKEPHAAIWQVPVSSGQDINMQNIMYFFIGKWVDSMRFSPRSHKLTFMSWHITFALVILTLCCPWRMPILGILCVSIEICAPVSIRNFISCHWGQSGIKM